MSANENASQAKGNQNGTVVEEGIQTQCFSSDEKTSQTESDQRDNAEKVQDGSDTDNDCFSEMDSISNSGESPSSNIIRKHDSPSVDLIQASTDPEVDLLISY